MNFHLSKDDINKEATNRVREDICHTRIWERIRVQHIVWNQEFAKKKKKSGTLTEKNMQIVNKRVKDEQLSRQKNTY